MKILLHGINFSPELTGIGKYTGEVAAWLVSRGHEVRVVTAPPYYPAWAVNPDYSASSYRTEQWQGVNIYRCPLWVPRQPGGVKRLLHLASFALSSFPVLLRQVFWRPDVVWVVEPALFCAPAAWSVARLCGAKAWLHVQDFEVDAAFDLGLLKGRYLRNWVASLERWLMRGFDRVSTISLAMHQRLLAKGVDASKARMAVNWVDLSRFVSPSAEGAAVYRRELSIPDGAAVALYSGNMGAKQGLETLAELARLCPTVFFVFCGNGAGRADLVARCAGLSNVRLMDLQPVERLPDLLVMADIHLLPQRADAADLVMPSKLTGMLASSRPVVATAHAGTELAKVAEACGLVVPPENPESFARAVMLLAQDATLRKELGAAGFEYAKAHLDQDAVLSKFENDLKELIKPPVSKQAEAIGKPWLQTLSALGALAMMAGLFIGGAQPIAVGLVPEPWDKLVHALAFAGLATLLAVALKGVHLLHGREALSQSKAIVLSAFVSALVAGADEIHQIWLPGRLAGWDDWLADVVGMVLALTVVRWLWRRNAGNL